MARRDRGIKMAGTLFNEVGLRHATSGSRKIGPPKPGEIVTD